jgi:DNA-binding PadR family transcriptional regulator
MAYRTDTRALVLAILRDGPTHGYGISKSIRERSGSALKLGEGQLYPILHELEETGCVTAEWEMQEGDPPRRVYALTEKGVKELSERAKKWSDFADAVGSVLSVAPMPRLEASHE